MPLPAAIHSTAQVRALDAHAIERLGIPGYTLMTRAGEAALGLLRRSWPRAEHVAVVCGGGNNAGDGYVLARLARMENLHVTLLAVVPPEQLRGDAATAWQDYVAAGGKVFPWSETELANSQADVIVDALFGTGLTRPLDPAWCRCIEALNAAHRPMMSLDIPSGLDADTGAVRGAAVRADRTCAFVGLKAGFYLGEGPDYVGTVLFDGLGIPESVVATVGCIATRLDAEFLTAALPPRRRGAHKGDHGHVLVIAGGTGMGGAARLAGEACLRVGAGRVTVATRAANVGALIAGRPELMTLAAESPHELRVLLERVDLIAIGPGLGTDEWARQVFAAALDSGLPLVVDADALNLLATTPCKRDNWILTPHPGEAARLLGCTSADIQADRLGSANRLRDRFGGIVVLKGAGTLIVREGQLPTICDYGNPGMASPGMGDVLTGVIAGIAAQLPDLWTAARAGVLVHAMAGDMAARKGERGLIASDLFAALPACVNPAR